MVAVYNWPLTASVFHSVGQAYKLSQRSTEPPIWIHLPRGAVAYLTTKRRSTAEAVSELLKMMFATTELMSPVAEELMQLYWPPETVKSISSCKDVNHQSRQREGKEGGREKQTQKSRCSHLQWSSKVRRDNNCVFRLAHESWEGN